MSRILPYGPSALLLELADADEARAAYAALRAAIDDGALAPPVDLVPAARTLLVDGVENLDHWCRAFETLDLTHTGAFEAREHVVPVTFDGPDLAVVAEHWGCSATDVVERLVSTEVMVEFCGFAPGFAYCRGIEATWPSVPRRREPRAKVPARSVALAGDYLGWYPRTSPGGWQLVGTTGVELFDTERERPALFAPGDRIRIEVES